MYKKMVLTEYLRKLKDTDSTHGIYIIEQKEKYISYCNLYNKALLILHNLQTGGLEPGDELIFQIKDGDNETFIYTFWACLLGGIIPVPVSVGTKDNISKVFNIWKLLNNPKVILSEEIKNKLIRFLEQNYSEESSKINIHNKMLLIDDMMKEIKYGVIQERQLDDIAFIQFSSGSTGNPNGVTLTHRNLITNIIDIIETSKVTKDDISLSWMPLTHDMGLIGFHLSPLVSGSDQYLMPTSLFVRNPILWMNKVNEHRATVLSSPNFGYRFLMDRMKDNEFQWNLSCIRKIFNGAEPISVEITEEFLNKFSVYGLKRTAMYPVYGMAEATLAVAFPKADEEYSYLNIKRESLNIGKKVIYCKEGEGVKYVDEGFPVKSCSVRVVGDYNEDLGEDVVGYIHIKGDNVTKEYYNNKQATEERITKDGWLNTGDLGFIRNNRIVVTGRYKDIIFVNGTNYYSHDLETICEDIEGISIGKLAVCGYFEQKIQKDKIIVFVIYKNKIEGFIPIINEIKSLMMQKVGIIVDEVIPVINIPKTTSGKFQRYKLVEKFKDGEYKQIVDNINELIIKRNITINETFNENEIEGVLLEISKKIFKTDLISVEDNFIELGGNSIIIANIHAELERTYPGMVKVTDLFSYPTISKLADFIRDSKKIVLKEVQILEEYLKSNLDEENNISFNLHIEDNIYTRLKELAVRESATVYDILLSLYIHLISQISDTSEINVQASNFSNNFICSVGVDVSNIETVTDLIKITKQILNSDKLQTTYLLTDLNSISLSRKANSIIPLFINDEIANKCNDDRLIEVFDLVYRVKEMENVIEINCQANGKRFIGETVEAFANSYMQIIELVTTGELVNG